MQKVVFLILTFFLFTLSCKKNDLSKNLLRTCFYSDPQTLDTRKAGDYTSSQILLMLYRGLMHYTSEGKLVCSLANSYEISDDKKKYLFYLKDATWSDGKPITAYDFENSWKKILEPSFPSLYAELLYPIKNAEKAKNNEIGIDQVQIKALDDKTLFVELENPNPYFLFLTSLYVYFPMPTHIIDNYQELPLNYFTFSGPFKLKKWYRNNQIILEKNPLFYDKDKIQLDYIYINIIPNENTCLQMYENNEIDFLSSFLSPFTVETLGKIQDREDVKIIPIAGFSFLTFNTNTFPFNNENLRKAFSIAIDRKKIIDNITQLNEKIALRCIPPILVNNENKDLIENNNVNLANIYFEKALKELKISKEALNITFSYGSYIIHRKEAEVLKQMWEKAFNISINLNLLEDKVFLSKLHNHNYQIGLARLIIRNNDPMNIFFRFKNKNSPKNYSGWENEKFIQVFNLAANELDLKKRMQIIEHAESILLDALPIAPLYFYNYTMLKKNYLKGVYTNIVGDLFFDETSIKR
jgi:oligopeptide transport system substrate-binding protein